MIERATAVKMLENNAVPLSLMQHSLAAEVVMQALARYFNEDELLWGLTGLLHDIDFPQTVSCLEKHGLLGSDMLVDKLPEQALQAIRAHNGEMNGCMPQSRLDYALRCGESVTGLISAAVLLRPGGYEGMEPKSLKKKMKDKAFAHNVCRENIRQCVNAGIELDEFLHIAIGAMSNLAK